MSGDIRPVIVGAGPAGIRAAQALAAAGLRPVVVDEAAKGGGQIYRRQPEGFIRDAKTLYGTEAAKATALHRTIDGLAVDHRPQTLVWNIEAGALDLLRDGQAERLPYSHLILATGATDRILPIPGWTLPGTYSLGAAQVALKYQGCGIGRRVAFIGTGPLLPLVASQYLKAGAEVAAVLDTARQADKLAALPGLLRGPTVLAKGLRLIAALKTGGVMMHQGARPLRILGTERVEGLVWHDGTREHRIDCDAVAFGYGLRSETQLADLAGCRFRFDPLNRAWLPERDAAGRSSVPGVYLAGDGAGIAGADAAELAGERAALALLQDLGRPVDTARAARLEAKLAAIGKFRQGLERAFPSPADWAAQAPDDLVVCRCEEVTAGTLRATATRWGTPEVNRLKALCRVGMGRCQGRMCGAAAAEILAAHRGVPVEAVGRLRGQAPVKPIPIAIEDSPEAAA
ncbi:NAD(P)/FAD-dependent oxidoreductase [Inquilinus sp.]|jgi:hydrogen cyanide synthase HcnB|uniref:NAD(P)/FAD-dependent oxidoreductase n=1 Tax=Inquilinus sp. TaxID=1932117 RepID=UPI0037850E71